MMKCLNPYYTGSWVAGCSFPMIKDAIKQGLNPYYTGSWVAGV